VETSYSIAFAQEPPAIVTTGAVITPSPAVQLSESGLPIGFSGNGISLTAVLGTLSGTTTQSTNGSGLATFAGLSIAPPENNDELTANLSLNPNLIGPPIAISAPSSQFNVGQATPTLSFAPNPASQTYGTAITSGSLDATATYNSTTVPGTFTYTTMVGGNPVTLVASTTVLPVGSYTITATFTPSDPAVYTGATTTASYMVNAAGLTITASTVTMSYGGTVPTITASYSGFANGDTAASLTTLPTCATTATSHSAVASYPSMCSGAVDANYTIGYVLGSVTVNQAMLSITASSAAMAYGGTVPMIAPSYSGFVSGDTVASLTTPPTCSTTATSLSPVGSYPSVCSGAVDANYTIAYMPGSVTVGQAASITTIHLSSTSITPGQSETITVTVASATTGAPTGSVNISDGGTLLATVTLTNGTGSYTTTTLAPGVTHVISAVYSGDTNFTGSTSTTSASVTVAALDFTMTISGPSSATVIPGQSISYQVSVTPMYGSYAGTVNFAVTGLPAGATVTFSPSTIAANGGPQTVTVTITAPPAAASNHNPSVPSPTRRAAPLALAFLLLFGLGAVRRRGRAARRLFAIVLLLAGGAVATMVSGCGGGFFAQAPQNY
ncbi:MAG: MBG domain-containing protein, partial [Terracidiphilus sp.]